MGRLGYILATVLPILVAAPPYTGAVAFTGRADRSTTAPLATVSVPANPVAVLVNEAAGRVFVLSQGQPDPRRMRYEQTEAAGLSMLDAATGALLRQIPAGHVGWRLALSGKMAEEFRSIAGRLW